MLGLHVLLFVDFDLRVGNLFRDEDYMTSFLSRQTGALSEDVASQLMNSRINLNSVHNIGLQPAPRTIGPPGADKGFYKWVEGWGGGLHVF